MDTREHKHALMQSKLEDGLSKLEGLTEDDKDLMGIVLIKLHGALEDFVRFEVGEKAPYLRAIVDDAKSTSWKELLEYGTTHLGFTENDRRTISEANVQRQKVAHGGNYEKKLADLKRYARFVQKWCKQASDPTADDWKQGQVIDLQKPYEPAAPPQYAAPPLPEREPEYETVPQRPWYRSTLFLLIAFFLFTPLWVYLILSDRDQHCLVRLVAYGMLLLGVFVCLGLGWYVSDSGGGFRELWNQFNIPAAGTSVSPGSIRPTANPSPQASPDDATSLPASGDGCTIVWAEHEGDDLGGKSRAMVWEQVVAQQVQGSGMTPRQFYNQVVERNPALAGDGFEFKTGKTYLLPACEQ